MNHLGTKTLETERLILRRFTVEDAQDMYNNWAGDEEVVKFLTWPVHKSVEASKEYIQTLIIDYSRPCKYEWGIELKELGQVIGSLGVVSLNEKTECAHIGYCIGRKWWNKGITSEAFSAVIKFLMEEVQVNRIDSRHDTKNPNSGRVMVRCGLKYEGTLRESDINNQGVCDTAWYGLLKKDYEVK